MGDFGVVVLIIFIIIRLMIAVGLLYLVVYEVRKLRASKKQKARNYEEADKDGHGKDVGGSSGGGN
jgi:predicted membrane protein